MSNRNVDIDFTVLNQIQSKLETAQNTSIVVGLIGNIDSEILMRGVYTEFGTNKFQGWRWLQKSVNYMKKDYSRIVANVIVQLLNNQNPNYNGIGLWASGKTKEMIGRIRSPKLSALTIQMKGSSKPLIDSGQMRNSVSYEIRVQR